MPEILRATTSVLLLAQLAAHAQQADSLAGPAPDSVRIGAANQLTAPVFSSFTTMQPALSRVAGVQVTPYSGAPGAPVAVRIRGAASLAGNAQPLYVVDGVPALEGPLWTEPSTRQTGITPATPTDFNPLLSLPAEDIESVTVLKGPLETARYGSQAQNGVIEIVTRRGQFGQVARVRYRGAGGVQQARYRYQLLGAREYAEVANEAAANLGRAPEFTAAQVAALGAGTDWQRELLRTAAVQEHHLSVEGGTRTARAYLGADYLAQTGVLVNSDLRRLSLSANLEQRLSKRLRLLLGLNLSQVSGHQPDQLVPLNLLMARPTSAPRDSRGELIEPRAVFENPLRQALQTYREPQQRRLLGRLSGTYELTTGLQFELGAGLERSALQLTGYSAAMSGGIFVGGRTLEANNTFDKLTLRPALRFERTLAGRHALAARVEGWRQAYRVASDYQEFAGSLQGGFGTAAAAASGLSYQAAGGYCFDGRYELQGSVQLSGPSAFSSDERWRRLPAAQLSWHAGQEAFLRDNPTVRRLDLLAGWGRTRGDGFFNQNYVVRPVPGGGVYYSFQNPLTTQQEAGLRLSLAPARLDLTLTAYQRLTEMSESALSLPLTASRLRSQLRNWGLELTAASTWIAGPVRGTSTLAAALNRNELQTDLRGSNGYGQRFADGEPLSAFYGLHYLGVDAATGQPRYQDLDGNGRLDFADQQYLGSGLPRQLLSFTQQLSYRRLSLLAQLDGLFGYRVQNAGLQYLDAADGYANNSDRVRERWQLTNRNTDVPAAGTLLPGFSDYTLQSGNHLRLTALTLECQVWAKAARSAAVWVGGNNLLVWSAYRGFDPNVSSGGMDNKSAGLDTSAYPVARTVSVGVRATL